MPGFFSLTARDSFVPKGAPTDDGERGKVVLDSQSYALWRRQLDTSWPVQGSNEDETASILVQNGECFRLLFASDDI